MNLKVILILFLATIVRLSNAQDEPKKIDLKIGFSFYKPIIRGYNQFDKKPNLNIELNYRSSRYLKSGIYIGASYLKNGKFLYDDSGLIKDFEEKGSIATYYGANINFSLLQILAKAEGLKPDFYAIARIGGRFISAPEHFLVRGNDFIWGGGLGMSYQFNRKVGAFVESTYGNNYFDTGFDIPFKEKIDFSMVFS